MSAMEKSPSLSSAPRSRTAQRRPANGGSGFSRANRPVTDRAVRAVARFSATERLFRGVKSVLVGVSGGPDSVACLVLLLALRERLGIEVAAAHFDHQLRPGSRSDLEFV